MRPIEKATLTCWTLWRKMMLESEAFTEKFLYKRNEKQEANANGYEEGKRQFKRFGGQPI